MPSKPAITIQKVVRGRQLRHVLPERVEEFRQTKAALKIQALMRGHLSRQKQAILLLEGQLKLIQKIKEMELQNIAKQKDESMKQARDVLSPRSKKAKSSVKAEDVIALLKIENEKSKREHAELQSQCCALLSENKTLEESFLYTTQLVASLEADVDELEQENKQWEAYIIEFQRHAAQFEMALRETEYLLAEEQKLKMNLLNTMAKIETRVSGKTSKQLNEAIGITNWSQMMPILS